MVQGQSNIYTKVSFGPEASAYGTEAAAYTSLSRVQSGTIDSMNNLILERGLGEGLNAVKTYWGPFECSGEVTFNVVDFTFLQHWIGNKSGSGTAGTPYILTEATTVSAVAAGAGIMQPFSVEMLNDDGPATVEAATGCYGTSFELSGELNGILSCSAKFGGQKSLFRASGQSYTPSTAGSFIMLNGTWKWGSSPSTLSGVRKFSISYSNGLVEGNETRTIESRFKTIPRMGQREYKFSIDIMMNSALAATIINDFYGYNSAGVYSPADGSANAGPTAALQFSINLISGNQYGNINLTEASIDRIGRGASLGQGLVVMTFEGVARKGLSSIPITWWSV